MLRARGGRARGPLKTRFAAVDDSETIPRRAYTYALPPLLPRPQPTLISPAQRQMLLPFAVRRCIYCHCSRSPYTLSVLSRIDLSTDEVSLILSDCVCSRYSPCLAARLTLLWLCSVLS